MNSYYRLYWKKSTGSYWSGGAYYQQLKLTLNEYQRMYFSWNVQDNEFEFKIVFTEISFENKTKITKETEYDPKELINELASESFGMNASSGGGS